VDLEGGEEEAVEAVEEEEDVEGVGAKAVVEDEDVEEDGKERRNSRFFKIPQDYRAELMSKHSYTEV